MNRLWRRCGTDKRSELTCVHACLAQEQRQTPHSVKRVEVMDILVQAVHAVLVLKRADKVRTSRMWRLHVHAQHTCGRPVRMEERLGEQLLTDVKAFRNSRLRCARARRWGVRTTELL